MLATAYRLKCTPLSRPTHCNCHRTIETKQWLNQTITNRTQVIVLSLRHCFPNRPPGVCGPQFQTGVRRSLRVREALTEGPREIILLLVEFREKKCVNFCIQSLLKICS